LFAKTQKVVPKDELSISSQYLIKASLVNKLTAGVYTYLPLGLMTLKKIENIIRQEMLKLDAQEILMPSLTPKELWETTGRWQTFSELYKIKDQSKKEYALAATHEEVIVPLIKNFIKSYKDLPLGVFQIQNKFRSELRAKSGLIRGREFIMKDLYSFHLDENDLNDYYNKVIQSYHNIFKRCGIGDLTFLTLSSGGTFSKYSHEFQTISSAGEDTIYLCNNCKQAINKEISTEQKKCSNCGNPKLEQKKSIEVGNIFKLMDKYSRPFNLNYQDKTGENKIILMGCYGIGLGRLLASVVEINHDPEGIIWPKNLTPFQLHLLDFDNQSFSKNYYQQLQTEGFTVLYDERELSAGQKLKDADLLGISVRLISSAKTKEKLEIKYRSESKTKIIDFKTLINELKHYYFNV